MSETTQVGQPGPRARVMLVDDDPFMLDMLADMLDELGSFDVVRETCAKRALRVLTASAPDLLICDLSMPDMDGIEFLQAAASAGFKGGVVLLSGLDTGVRNAAEGLARAHGLRVLGSFKKPASLDTLRAAIEPILHKDDTGAG
ncbi:response regulator [Massilia cavernae]|uniref:Response regulator n=1 Tax=Massilia cavernae TaxID=2320864 RepID=A0A418XRY5_9BURK|nr:response regulator [Massilia cavernae]RJG15297.1 response regulator [Massilia cavernae]